VNTFTSFRWQCYLACLVGLVRMTARQGGCVELA
jgi:hypothetical protein